MTLELVPRTQRSLVLALVIEGEPVPKQRVRTGKGRFYTPTKTLVHEEKIAWLARGKVSEPQRGDLIVELDFFMGNRRKLDLDNLIKTAFDAANGVIWRDDSQVVELVAHKHVDRVKPRTELRVWRTLEAV